MKKTVMTKTEMLDQLSNSTGLSKKDISSVLQAYNELVMVELKAGNEVKLPDLGKFKVSKTAARMGRNPSTGQEIKIPAKTKVKFLISKSLKEIA